MGCIGRVNLFVVIIVIVIIFIVVSVLLHFTQTGEVYKFLISNLTLLFYITLSA